MQYEWSSEPETGLPTIDDEHKQLVAALNDLLIACGHGRHKAELKKTVNSFVAYTVKHFSDEEAFLFQCKYPDYPQHKQLHGDFKAIATDLAERLLEEGASIALIAEAQPTIDDWLFKHIKGEYLKVERHVRGQS